MAQTMPSAGRQMQQIPNIASPPNTPVPVAVQPSFSTTAPPQQGTSFVAQRLIITGARAFAQTELVAVAGFQSGHSLSLSAVYDMAEKSHSDIGMMVSLWRKRICPHKKSKMGWSPLR
jgi:hypothetical protein